MPDTYYEQIEWRLWQIRTAGQVFGRLVGQRAARHRRIWRGRLRGRMHV